MPQRYQEEFVLSSLPKNLPDKRRFCTEFNPRVHELKCIDMSQSSATTSPRLLKRQNLAARPLRVQVQGPNGTTTVQLPVPWLVAMRFEFNAGNERMRRVAKIAAETARLNFRPGEGAVFSQVVRDETRMAFVKNGR